MPIISYIMRYLASTTCYLNKALLIVQSLNNVRIIYCIYFVYYEIFTEVLNQVPSRVFCGLWVFDNSFPYIFMR